ncbi:MAG TPA: hypothetical protein VGV60_07545 [Candidatus Polarisedimenticolia bacterium]|nr:hypothetical protein [Candidatus Polarisedimenticolia bacterium]
MRVLRGPAILVCGALLACGGPGGGSDGPPLGPPGPVPTFRCEDSAPAADHVVLRCAGQIAPDEWLIDVVVGFPTTSDDINGFSFYVEFDPLQLAFVTGSGIEGDFLNQDHETVLFAAAIDPTDPGRLIVGINRAGGSGTAGVPGHDLIMSFRIRALIAAPFGPVFPAFKNARADDSSGQAIPEIVFDDQLQLSVE